jgi:aryl-alcohol dehydrogenase-like predicted oxidoreductase
MSDKTLVQMDKEIYSWHEKNKMPLMAYSSLCHGYFSRKRTGTVYEALDKVYNNPANLKLLEKLAQWEKDYHVSTAVLVSAYVRAHDFPSVPISSFSTFEQLEELIKASDFDFPRELLNEIQAVKQYTNPLNQVSSAEKDSN